MITEKDILRIVTKVASTISDKNYFEILKNDDALEYDMLGNIRYDFDLDDINERYEHVLDFRDENFTRIQNYARELIERA